MEKTDKMEIQVSSSFVIIRHNHHYYNYYDRYKHTIINVVVIFVESNETLYF